MLYDLSFCRAFYIFLSHRVFLLPYFLVASCDRAHSRLFFSTSFKIKEETHRALAEMVGENGQRMDGMLANDHSDFPLI